jgi:UDP-N-acetylglucosamine--N-acetylmuramyl-(pentapeptide) pyrophosphoryl-undecaprenol N-acetylglucosamine transferase
MSRVAEGTAPIRVALAASPGGHIDLLTALAETVSDAERVWVVPDGARRAALAAQGERTAAVRIFGGSPRALLANLREVGRALRGFRPEVVVTSGAGVVVPYCVLARALGARVIFIETMARVTSGSRAGRVLSRLAEATLVQWPESLAVYPGACVCSPPLLAAPDGADTPDPAPRAGTFVALGTHWQPFARLMAMVEEAAAEGILPAPIVAQVGDFTYRSERVTTVPSFTPGRLAELMHNSAIVVCHGGAGIIASTIRAGRRPLVLARRQGLGEHIDDHQQELVDKLSSLDLLVAVRERITAEDVEAGDADVSARLPLAGQPMADALAAALRCAVR